VLPVRLIAVPMLWLSVADAVGWLSKNVANDPVGDVPVHVFALLGPGAAFANACVSS
jgi:hypothetical protein